MKADFRVFPDAANAAKRNEKQEDVLMRLGAAIAAFSSRLLDDLDLG